MLRRLIWLASTATTLTGCASGLRLYADDVPHGALRAGEVLALADKRQLKTLEETRTALLATNIPKKNLGDRSLAAVRVNCCGGSIEKSSNLFVYVPPDLHVDSGDIVVIRSGKPARGNTPASPNTAVRIAEKRGVADPQCRWEHPSLYERLKYYERGDILYCDWMPKQGWIEPTASYPVWFKPPSP